MCVVTIKNAVFRIPLAIQIMLISSSKSIYHMPYFQHTILTPAKSFQNFANFSPSDSCILVKKKKNVVAIYTIYILLYSI